jgi:hypothetical protein
VATRHAMADTPTEVVPSAGSLRRSHLGAGYLSVGLTFGSGSIPQDVPTRRQPPLKLASTPCPTGRSLGSRASPRTTGGSTTPTASGSSAPATTRTMTWARKVPGSV